ncbi:MAG: RNA-guided endonuclease TnpB family protein, partial [Caldilineaceae bacterium]
IYPTEDQEAALRVQFGHSRFVYNRFIDSRKTTFLTTGKGVSFYDFKKQVTAMKQQPDFAWLKEADSQVLQASLEDADRAYQNFFRNHNAGTLPKPGKKPRKDGMPKGYPTFWSKHDDQSIRYPQRFKFDNNKIYLPKVGWVKVVRHRRIEGEMKNCTVSKTKTGKFFVSIQCEIEKDVQPTTNRQAVGIDLGLKDFAILSSQDETTKIEPPKHLRKAEKLLKIRQRRVSRKVKGSNSRNKARLVVAATHEKIANRRKDFHHQLTRRIVNQFGTIGMETLNVKGMIRNHSLAKSIADAGWSQFVNFIEYKAAWTGVEIVRHDRWFASSKSCHDCGYIKRDLPIKDRTWVCPSCGVIHDRDENAARNLIPTTVGATGSNAVGDVSSGAPWYRVKGKKQSLWEP